MDEGGAKEDYSLSFELEDSDESLQLSSEDVSQPSPDSDAAKEPRPPVRTTTTTTTTTTSKKPPRPPSAASGDGSISLSRTIRSPLAMAHLLNQDRVTDDSDAHASPSPHTLKPPTFKQVASTVQTMQSTAKKFKSSGEIREVAYKEWLAKKEAKDMHERAKCAASKESAEDRAKQQQKEVQMAQRAAEKVKKWTASKEAVSRSKQKLKSKENQQKETEMEEKLTKTQEGKAAAERWRQENKRRYVHKVREKKMMQSQEAKREQEEREEKKVANKQAFQSWSQHKDEVLKENTRKQREEKTKHEKSAKQKALLRRESALESFEAWKSKKDEKIMGTKRLYSYMDRAKVHEKSWCPARSMQYSYPTFPNKERHGKNKVTKTIAEDSSKDNSGCSNDGSKNASDRCSSGSSNDMDSYSTASFESDPSDVASSDGESDTDSSEPVESVSRSSPSKTGRQKTIQVCCQTLQYWCTCDQ